MSTYPSRFLNCPCTIRERFAPTAFHAELPNGKETIAFVQRREAHLLDVLKPGDIVMVTICPADFDRARIRQLLQPATQTM